MVLQREKYTLIFTLTQFGWHWIFQKKSINFTIFPKIYLTLTEIRSGTCNKINLSTKDWDQHALHSLHRKWSFSLRIFPANVNKSSVSCRFVYINWRSIEEILNRKLHFCTVISLPLFGVFCECFCDFSRCNSEQRLQNIP